MTTRRLLTTAASAAVLAYALGATIPTIGAHDVTPPSSTTVYVQECTTVVGWDATVQAYGAEDATTAWTELVDRGWTNPRNGDVTLLVEPGCA